MVDILKQLQKASFDEIGFPVSSYSWGYTQEDSKHKFVFKDQELVLPLGRTNKTWRFDIPFYENITEDYHNLYTVQFPAFLAAVEDGKAKTLETPDFGSYQAICISVNPSYDMNRRDGVMLSVEFLESPEFASFEDAQSSKYVGPTAVDDLAGRLDQDLPEADIPDYIPPRDGFQNPLRTITAIADQVSLAREQYKAQVDYVVYEIDRLNTAIDNTSDPQNWKLKRQNQELKRAIYDSKKQVDTLGRTIIQETINSPKSIMVVAAQHEMTLREFIDLNASLAKSPVLPVGTIYNRVQK